MKINMKMMIVLFFLVLITTACTAEKEQEVLGDNPVQVSHEVVLKDGFYYINGNIKNNTIYECDYILSAIAYDSDGVQIDTSAKEIYHLAPDGIAKFSFNLTNDRSFKSYEINKILIDYYISKDEWKQYILPLNGQEVGTYE